MNGHHLYQCIVWSNSGDPQQATSRIYMLCVVEETSNPNEKKNKKKQLPKRTVTLPVNARATTMLHNPVVRQNHVDIMWPLYQNPEMKPGHLFAESATVIGQAFFFQEVRESLKMHHPWKLTTLEITHLQSICNL